MSITSSLPRPGLSDLLNQINILHFIIDEDAAGAWKVHTLIGRATENEANQLSQLLFENDIKSTAGKYKGVSQCEGGYCISLTINNFKKIIEHFTYTQIPQFILLFKTKLSEKKNPYIDFPGIN